MINLQCTISINLSFTVYMYGNKKLDEISVLYLIRA